MSKYAVQDFQNLKGILNTGSCNLCWRQVTSGKDNLFHAMIHCNGKGHQKLLIAEVKKSQEHHAKLIANFKAADERIVKWNERMKTVLPQAKEQIKLAHDLKTRAIFILEVEKRHCESIMADFKKAKDELEFYQKNDNYYKLL